MPRFLALIVLFVAGWMSGSALALSLGDIDLKSGLNQPFVAEIPVTTDSAGDIAALRVGVASSATFSQYGLDRAGFLSDFDFEIIATGANGVVRITSRNPVVEPFVTLLLEISWPQGRLLREYTVLLDPPVFASETVAPTVASPTAGPAPVSAQPAPRAAAPAPAQPSARPAPQTSAAPAPRAPMPAGNSYGPVQRNDTLWAIAGRYADSAGVDRNQMMLAIYRANPDAFVGNINRLKAGMILRVPDQAEIGRLNNREAMVEVMRQNKAWSGAADDAGTLRLVPPPDAADDARVADTGDRAGTATGAGSGDSSALQSRVEELEAELAENRRLLQIRDEELSALQGQLSEADQPVMPGIGEEPVVDEPLEVPIDEPAAALGDDTMGDETMAGDEAMVGEPIDEPAPAVDEPADVAPPPTAVVTTTPAEEKSLLGGLFSNIWLYVALGGVLLLALFIVKRRSAEDDTPPWSRLDDVEPTAGEEAGETTQQLAAAPAEDASFVVEESAPAERTDQDQAPFDTGVAEAAFSTDQDVPETPLERTISAESPVNLDEADPIAEADFHMAYGLYDQAADLLTNSLSAEPERKDLRMKLLEVYFIWENQGGFLREAQELQQQVDDPADADWNKVLIMGKQICPDEDLFSASPSAPGAASDMDFSLGEDAGGDGDDNIDFDFSATGSDVDAAFDEDAGGLDFDLSGDDLAGAGDDAEESLDFDISEAEEATLMSDDVDLGDATMESPISPPSETTMETPTIESEALDSSALDPTMESPISPPSDDMLDPTMESPISPPSETTMETPTIESEALETTMETPTVESPIGEFEDGSTRSDQTAEIELDDLGLDLSDLEDEVAAGAADIESADAGIAAENLQVDGDGLESLDDTQQRKLPPIEDMDEDDLGGLVDAEATGEMLGLSDTAEQPAIGDTLEQPEVPVGADTMEQPGLGGASDTAEQPAILDAAADVDFDVGEEFADSDSTTSVVSAPATVGNGATMTEVGTKLDLARAYIDMGDPDGARSILNEVLEEASDDQRQEAQKLLDDLAD
ncbi:MAG: FimV/HubP family polar landmark protein [Gammaproteobacteria bacterium]